MFRIGAALTLLVTSAAGVQAQEKPRAYTPPDEKLPVVVAPQPFPFSHKKHAAAGQTCLDCHARAAERESAGFPSTDQCMTCHETIKADSAKIKKLAAAHRRGDMVKWVRVYRLEDFVFFSHASHFKAGVQCESCHGPVAERDVLAKEVSINMVACMNCHAARKAPNGCSFCHQLGH
jgi:hypothetical protein